MRRFVILLLLGWLIGASSGRAQETVVQTFDGTTAQTMPSFQVQDKWEVRWDCPDIVLITVLAPDGTVAAGAAGSLKGSLYLPKGGSFSLKISRGSDAATSTWHLTVVQIGSAASPSTVASNYVPPESARADAATNATPAPAPPSLTTLSSISASSAGELTEAQAHAVVVIKGDVAEGTGFLVKTADGPTVVTNLHVLAANPNVKILTTTGAQIKTLGLKGASDRDLAMISIQDDHYTYLELATDIANTVQNGDEAITPGNSEGGEVVLDTKGTVLGIGPEKIEFSNPIYHGNSGGPVFHTKSGKVLAVVTQALKVNTNNDIDKASFENKNSAISGAMRYFGLRIDTVPNWEMYDWNRFLNETTFIQNFHDVSRCLDSYMNGVHYEQSHTATSDEYGPPNARYYLKNEKIQHAHDNWRHQVADADTSQKLDASREMVMDLEGIAGADLNAIQNPGNFYAFDQIRAAQEAKYRQALEKEIENYGDKISDEGH